MVNLVRERVRLPQDAVSKGLLGMIVITILAAMAGVWVYNRVHLFDGYRIVQHIEEHDVEGTRYAVLGGHVIKYGHDGVFCVDTENRSLWSIAYSMQTPVCDTCGSVMVIAELQGRQVYVLNGSGLMGNFETGRNIRKAKVASNGVTALLMDEDDVSWIGLYDKNGQEIASVRLTLEDSGYPVNLAVTPDAKQMAVSLVKVENAQITGALAFYDFASSSSDRHLMQTVEYANELFPEVFYLSGKVPVAAGSNGFAVFTSGKRPQQKTYVPMSREIVSCFHDDANIGFVLPSEKADVRYEMEVYSASGKRAIQTDVGFEYSGVTMEGGEILLYDTSHLYVYRQSGRQKLSASYSSEVRYFAPLEGLRKYLVITEESMDRIRIE